MIEIKDKHKCVGCKACNIVCPKDCISFYNDNEGFVYPLVDKALCINCGKCDRVCPVINRYNSSIPIDSFAAKSIDKEIVRRSSSGGIFYSLAKLIFNKQGVVFGARFNDDWQVVYDYCEKDSDILPFLGSKYAQADLCDSFIKVKEFLKADRYVLFVGTPCYIAALKRYLRKDFDKLLLVDFICHGVPSPKVWDLFNRKYVNQSETKKISFRDKTNGWRHFSISFEKQNGEKKVLGIDENLYQKALVKSLTLRPSCYKCPSKGFRSKSDVTIGDFWGINRVLNRKDDDTGISFVTVNNKNGEDWFLKMENVEKEKVHFSKALVFNDHLLKSTGKNRHRYDFFKNIDNKDILINLRENLKYGYIDKKMYKLNLKLYTIERFIFLLKNKKRD